MHPYGVHWSRERAEGEWTCDYEKKKKSRPIMGAPVGHPYAHPSGVCINGLGALPSPYGPTLRGAHNALRASKKKKNVTHEVDQPSNNGQNLCKPSQYVRLSHPYLPHRSEN